MTQKQLALILIGALLVIVVLFVVLLHQHKPQLGVPITNTLPPQVTVKPTSSPVTQSTTPVKSNIIVWGRITSTDNKPLAGIVASFNGEGVKTNADGSYTIVLNKAGSYPLTFYDSTTLVRYKIHNDYEQVLYLSKGDNLHQDFVLERVKSTP